MARRHREKEKMMVDLLVVVLCCFADYTVASFNESRLQADLFRNYEKGIRPVVSPEQTLEMEFGLSITQLLNVDEKNQIMQISVWMKQQWQDYRLQWMPENYTGIASVVLSFERLWYPDMALYNSADGNYDLQRSINARVSSEGVVKIAPPAILTSPCVIHIEYFPFDVQQCSLKFGTWEYNGNETLLQPMHEHIVKEDFLENVEWEIVSSDVENLLVKYPCCPYVYSNLIYTLVIRRRPLYYIVNMVIPCFSMSFITLFVFYLPPDSGEKIALSISILLALSVLNLIIAEIMPPTSETTPLIVKYILFCMFIVMTSIISTIVVLNFHYRNKNTHKMPTLVRKIFLEVLPKFLCMKRTETGRRSKETLYKEMHELAVLERTVEGACHPYNYNFSGSPKSRTKKKPAENGGDRVQRSSLSRKRQSSLRQTCPRHADLSDFEPGGSVHAQTADLTRNNRQPQRDPDTQRNLSMSSKDSPVEQSDYTETEALLVRQDSMRQNVPPPPPPPPQSDGGDTIYQEQDNSGLSLTGRDGFSLTPFQRKLLRNLDVITDFVKREGDEYEVREDWKYVAMVVDRILLVLYSIGFLTGNCIVLLLISGVC